MKTNEPYSDAELDRRANLRKLATFLMALPEDYDKFDMNLYCFNEKVSSSAEADESIALLNECGTVACALGHGPLAGIPAGKRETWETYAERCFTGSDIDENFFRFLFSGSWEIRDNSPYGAGQRILYYLEHGLPEDVDDMIVGSTELCYTEMTL